LWCNIDEMLSKTCEYAIRALIYLAQHSGEGQMVSIKEIAGKIDSPELFVGKILQGLSKQGFLQSAKGRYGGFYMNEQDVKKSLADIVIAIDGDKIFTGCGVGLDYCSETKPCPIHHEYKKARNILHNLYQSATFEQFKSLDAGETIMLKRI